MQYDAAQQAREEREQKARTCRPMRSARPLDTCTFGNGPQRGDSRMAPPPAPDMYKYADAKSMEKHIPSVYFNHGKTYARRTKGSLHRPQSERSLHRPQSPPAQPRRPLSPPKRAQQPQSDVLREALIAQGVDAAKAEALSGQAHAVGERLDGEVAEQGSASQADGTVEHVHRTYHVKIKRRVHHGSSPEDTPNGQAGAAGGVIESSVNEGVEVSRRAAGEIDYKATGMVHSHEVL